MQNGVHKRILSALFWAMDHSGTDGAGAGAASVAESFRGHFRKYGTCNTGGAAAFPVFAQVWSEQFWHITHLKEQVFGVTITKTFGGAAMKNLIENLKSDIKSNPAKFCSDSDVPVLDTLYWHYCEDVGIETPESKTANAKFGTALEFLPVEKANEIYTLAVIMNAGETRAAFHAGVKLGVQLMLEVEKEDC